MVRESESDTVFENPESDVVFENPESNVVLENLESDTVFEPLDTACKNPESSETSKGHRRAARRRGYRAAEWNAETRDLMSLMSLMM